MRAPIEALAIARVCWIEHRPRLSEQRPFHARLNLCIQVELVPEPTKSGIERMSSGRSRPRPRALPRSACAVDVRTAPATDAMAARAVFAAFAPSRRAERERPQLDTLSMG